jgi:RNA 2',3'-cyclic 3'-phosphodiesterase
VRTFVAIDLDPEIKSGLSDLVRALRKLAPPGAVGWVKDAGMHLTLKFLGEISESQVADVAAAVKTAASSVATFPLKVRGTGFFPSNPRAPRVLWVGMAPDPILGELFDRLELNLEGLGFVRETRPFHPHVTLGRVKSASGLRDVIAEVERNRNSDFGAMTVRTLTVFKSVLTPGGAVYSVLDEGPLL